MLVVSPAVSLATIPRRSQVYQQFRLKYSWRPKAVRFKTSPAAAADLIFAVLYQTIASGEVCFGIDLHRDTYSHSKASYSDVSIISNRLLDDSLIRVAVPARLGWLPSERRRCIYELAKTSWIYVMLQEHFSSASTSFQYRCAIVRSPWAALSKRQQDDFKRRNKIDAKVSPTSSQLLKRYKSSLQYEAGKPVTDGKCLGILERINRFSERYTWTLNGDCSARGWKAPAGRRRLYRRIFTEGVDGWEHGRLYSWGQNLPSNVRACLEVDSQPVVEIDFSAMHPSIIYNLAGKDSPGDAYNSLLSNRVDCAPVDIAPVAAEQRKRARQQVKAAVVVGINASTANTWHRALWYYHGPNGKKKDKRIYATKAEISAVIALVNADPILKPKLGTGFGNTLMKIDSEIMVRCLLDLVDREIPFLAVHDSLVVPRKDEATVKDVMAAAYFAQLGYAPSPLKVKGPRTEAGGDIAFDEAAPIDARLAEPFPHGALVVGRCAAPMPDRNSAKLIANKIHA